MACMSTDRSNVELLAVVADFVQRFSATVIGVCAKQLSVHSSVLAIGPGEPRGYELDKFRDRLAVVEAEFRSALPMIAAIAKDLDADLVVAGAFGQSRLREWAFGGVTQDLLARGERCTLVSH
jgi:nucleotide-binding universal stress UspA family protein